MKKKLCIIVLIFFVTITKAQTITMPDAGLRYWLFQSDVSNSIARDANWQNIKIDLNEDGEIQQSEALRVYTLEVSFISIYNLIGLEYFTNLNWLEIKNTQITAVDLTPFVNLTELVFENNDQITSVNISTLNNLNAIIFSGNQLLTGLNLTGLVGLIGITIGGNPQINNLNFSGLINLQDIVIGENVSTLNFSGLVNLKRAFIRFCPLITNLDFSGNPLFEDLTLTDNPNLTTLKIKNGRPQILNNTLCFWYNNPNLNNICADAAEIPAIQSYLSACGITQAITIDSACSLGTEGFELQNISVYPNPATHSFAVNISISKVAVYNLTGQLVAQFTGGFESGYNYDIQSLSAGVYVVKIIDDGNEKVMKLVKE